MATLETITTPSCDRSGKNPSGTADIAAKRLLKHGTSAHDVVAIASATTDVPAGVTTEIIRGGESRSYQYDGRAIVTSGAAVNIGDEITTDAAGKGVTASQSPGATQRVWGVAKTATTGADEDFEIELRQLGMAYNSVVAVADRAALKAIAATNRFDGMFVLIKTDESQWIFESASAAAADGADEIVIVPTAGTGRWIRAQQSFVAKLAFTYETADAAALLTVPEGFVLRLGGHGWWEIDVAMTGGSSSAIGVSTNLTGYDTKGDLLGGASGDVAATLGAGIAVGTQGGELDDNVGFNAILIEEAKTIRFDRITSAFTAGSGKACLPVYLAKAPATP